MKPVSGLIVNLALIFAIVAPASAADMMTEQQRALHVLDRLGYGPKPGDVDRVVKMGVDRYIDRQLHADSIPMPVALTQRVDSLATQEMSPAELIKEFRADNTKNQATEARKELVQRVAEQSAEARLTTAIDSPRQLEEVMVDFWFNHFNVYAGKGLDRVLVSSYEREAIRPYVFGHFRDLLGATAKHPAMLFYLDNWLSVAPGFEQASFRNKVQAKTQASGLNENYARELMELHTLGVDGGYTQKDVTELARMLTGWTFDPRRGGGNGAFVFDMRRHDTGDKEWLGRHVTARGQAEGEWALDVLAADPATAKHISFELAQYFVADQPSAALVDRLSKRYTDTQGDIRAVLATLFASPEFWDSNNVDNKFKTPYQYVVSAIRASDAQVINVRPLLGGLIQLGMPLYGCQTPDGYKNTEQAWLNPDAITRRINFATMLATGKLPLDKAYDGDAGQAMGKKALDRSADARPGEAKSRGMNPIDASQLMTTLGNTISPKTRAVIAGTEPALQSAMIMGSPDFMRH